MLNTFSANLSPLSYRGILREVLHHYIFSNLINVFKGSYQASFLVHLMEYI